MMYVDPDGKNPQAVEALVIAVDYSLVAIGAIELGLIFCRNAAGDIMAASHQYVPTVYLGEIDPETGVQAYISDFSDSNEILKEQIKKVEYEAMSNFILHNR